MLRSLSEFHHPDVPTYDVLEWSTPLDSSDFSPACWVTLAEQIEQHYYDYDGFVILHGTDTMAYTASALSFMLENLGKAVIITGAMIPMAFPVSDAKRNLIVSLMCAANLDIPESVDQPGTQQQKRAHTRNDAATLGSVACAIVVACARFSRAWVPMFGVSSADLVCCVKIVFSRCTECT